VDRDGNETVKDVTADNCAVVGRDCLGHWGRLDHAEFVKRQSVLVGDGVVVNQGIFAGHSCGLLLDKLAAELDCFEPKKEKEKKNAFLRRWIFR